ncbi:MAG: peptidoglycan editing factor PgeF [Alphaproteobacteria bacterium]|nr:peptidoglycan editing factor PgeF [Alphaproteobacteria bacterium]
MIYKAKNLPQEKHAFFGSHGGVSTGVYSSLNTNDFSLDNKESIAKNYQIIGEHLNLSKENLCLQRQGVSNIANYVTQTGFYQTVGDGLVTDKKDVILCLRTADCAPVLLADWKNGIIGAAHAGWRGALRGVIENTISLMLEKGAKIENIDAAVGPCLLKNSFDAGQDMVDEFAAKSPDFVKYFPAFGDKFKFDSKSFILDILKRYSLNSVTFSDIDTYTDKNFFSYRRSGHNKEIKQQNDFPTQLSTIKL